MNPAHLPVFNLRPAVRIAGVEGTCCSGWQSVGRRLREAWDATNAARGTIAVECYPGVDVAAVGETLRELLEPDAYFETSAAFRDAEEIDRRVAPLLTDDPVFGHMGSLELDDFLDPPRIAEMRKRVMAVERGLVLVCGVGATLLCDPQILVYADLARWEAQLRFRRNTSSNLGVENRDAPWQQQYKRGFFVDWRVADRHKQRLIGHWDFLLDTHEVQRPKLVDGEALRDALKHTARRPFSVVPYFDPAPWGGHWMQTAFGLDSHAENYGWCFNCVPEENSLLFDFDGEVVELPAIDLVFYQPRELLGPEVYHRYGAEFPIRFDFLDTFGGGNLSLQVHPTTDYIRRTFGMAYTQDESYYFLRAKSHASVYLGLKEDTDPRQMLEALAAAQQRQVPFDAERFVNRFPVRAHDHVHIPAGTVHCQGADSVVLEISSTPYLFTFKLWDWQRSGLDGRPRPIHLDHGAEVIDWTRTTKWVRAHLLNTVTPVASGDGWREERTGLHPLEPLETRRHWFTKAVPHHTGEAVNVLCLVEGDEVIVESPQGAFDPFPVHYAEAFIVPAAVGPFTVRPHCASAPREHATIKAFVRPPSADDSKGVARFT